MPKRKRSSSILSLSSSTSSLQLSNIPESKFVTTVHPAFAKLMPDSPDGIQFLFGQRFYDAMRQEFFDRRFGFQYQVTSSLAIEELRRLIALKVYSKDEAKFISPTPLMDEMVRNLSQRGKRMLICCSGMQQYSTPVFTRISKTPYHFSFIIDQPEQATENRKHENIVGMKWASGIISFLAPRLLLKKSLTQTMRSHPLRKSNAPFFQGLLEFVRWGPRSRAPFYLVMFIILLNLLEE